MGKTNEIILDSNVILRFLIKDNSYHFIEAEKLIKKIAQKKIFGLISVLVINEMLWILKTYYHIEKNVYIPQILKLIALENIEIIEVSKDMLIKSLQQFQIKNLDFTDIYLFTIAEGKEIFSFDQDLRKLQKSH